MDRTTMTADPMLPKPSCIAGLTRDWSFKAGPVPRWRRRQVIETLLRRGHARPQWRALQPLSPRERWMVYFMFSADGSLTPAHRFTLARLRDMSFNIFIVFASSTPQQVPAELNHYAEAIYWKGLGGYDFSAYTLALREISKYSEGADVFVMNDSVFGPFSDLSADLQRTPWQLTGYTASFQEAPHIQSYAFILKAVTRQRMRRLATVFLPFTAFSAIQDVVTVQELRLARVAARSMRVGAFWLADSSDVVDPVLVRPFELLATGFPFLKKSLLGKHKSFQDYDRVLATLARLGHPLQGL